MDPTGFMEDRGIVPIVFALLVLDIAGLGLGIDLVSREYLNEVCLSEIYAKSV